MLKRVIFSLALSGLSALCWANELVDLGPKANLERADAVAIGTATEIGIHARPEYPSQTFMRIKVEAVLKGEIRVESILVPYGRYSAEFRCKDGVVGQRYLLFLNRGEEPTLYFPQDFCYGVNELNHTRVTSR
jgi:hypothetical protein